MIETAQIIMSIATVVGTMVASFGGIIVSNKLTTYRIEQLEKKVEKHNTLVERMTKVEMRLDNVEEREENG